MRLGKMRSNHGPGILKNNLRLTEMKECLCWLKATGAVHCTTAQQHSETSNAESEGNVWQQVAAQQLPLGLPQKNIMQGKPKNHARLNNHGTCSPS